MKRALALLLTVAAAACASSRQQTKKEDRVLPDVELVQLVGAQPVQMTGPFDVRYAVDVTNPSSQPITLRRIEVRQIGSGAYQLVRNMPVLVNETIEPGGNAQVAFWLHAYVYVLPGSVGSNEPVNIRVITYFESPTGPFQKIMQTILGQF
jgi:hypothetical protein